MYGSSNLSLDQKLKPSSSIVDTDLPRFLYDIFIQVVCIHDSRSIIVTWTRIEKSNRDVASWTQALKGDN